jgi:inorganic triphosphatase YgiF
MDIVNSRTGKAAISTEVELKLSAQPTDLPLLRQALHELAPGSVTTQERLLSTYYDTPELVLKERALTLRVRERNGHFVQTVKTGDFAGADILSRGEWEDSLDDERPDPEAPQSGPQLPAGIGEDLRPIFATDVMRTVIDIEPSPGTLIEVAIDEGEIRVVGGQATEPIAEIELELKSGDPAALYGLALRLLEIAPIRIETRSKSERGYRLARGAEAPPEAVRAQPVILQPEMTVDAALQQIGRNCMAQLLRNEPAILAGRPEGVHQMRVAVRRIRSAISSLKKMLPDEDRRWVSEELGWLGKALGPARNLDVFATELLEGARPALPADASSDELASTLDRLREAAYRRVKDAVLSQRYTIAMLRLLRWFEARGQQETTASNSSIGKIAPLVLKQRRRKLRQRSKGFESLTPAERHKVRIAAKKLRYTIELFGSLFNKDDLENYTKRLKSLQDDLGYANDVRVAHDFVAEFFAETDPRGPAARAWIGVLEFHDQRMAAAERKLRKHLRRLNREPAFWRG